MSEAYFLGVDAGNTKTVALVARADGAVLGWGRSGGGDIYVSEDGATGAVAEAVAQALEAANLCAADLTASCLSLVGADWPEDFSFWQQEAEKQQYGRRTLVVNDALGALRAGTADDGVVVVCGTGAAIGARHGNAVWHSSFWQEPMGGHELGERALRAVYRAELELAPKTLLTDLILEYCHAPSVESLLHSMTARRARMRSRFTGLSRLLLDAAALGDEVALGEVARAARILGDYAWVGACKVGLAQKPFSLLLGGGVLRHESAIMRESIAAYVKVRLTQARCLQTPFEPVVGALLLALESYSSVPVTDYRALRRSLPQADFFAT